MHRMPDSVRGDAMIAVTARLQGLTVVTRHVNNFTPFGVALVLLFKGR